MKPRLILALFALLFLSVIALGVTPVAHSQSPTPSTPPGVIVTTAVTVPATATIANVPPVAKTSRVGLEDQLAQIVTANRAGDAQKLATFGAERHVNLTNKTARVILEMDVNPDAHPIASSRIETITRADGRQTQIQHAPAIAIRTDLAQWIATAGATYETAHKTSVQVSVPFDRLESLAQITGVRRVRLPYPAQPHVLPPRLGPSGSSPQVGTYTSEGVNLTNTNTWQSAGYNGSGANAAIFDFGFTGWAARQSSNDLPVGAVLKDFSASYNFSPDTAGYEHGTACAEIVYDMAPSATLYLYAFSTDVEFANAVNDYIAVNNGNKKVATMSIGWVNAGPYDGTGAIDDPVNSAQSNGIFFAVSAGNNQKSHWSGTATQSGTTDYLAFGDGNIQGIGPSSGSLWNIPSGTQLRIFLEWNDWNAGRTGNQGHIDYDMYLFRWSTGWTQVAQSLNNQCGTTAAPTEAINYTVPSGGLYNYGIVIARYTGGGTCPNNFGHWMQLHTFNSFGASNSFWYTNPCNSVTIPSDGDSAIGVGATFWNEDSASPLYGLEPFSGLGPRNAAGGGNPGTTFSKPDVAAPDGVSGVTYGASNGVNYAGGGTGFWGTSAAAPHVGGMAAVIWSGRPDYTLTQLRNYVTSQSIYKADGGTCGGTNPNNRYGNGRVNLGTAPVPGLWDGGGADNNWNTAANWDDGRVPGTSTTVLFNSTSSKNATVNISPTIASLTMDTGYGGTVTLGGNLTVNNNMTLNSGTLDVSTGDYAINVGGSWTSTGGTFTPRNGTVTFNKGGTATFSLPAQSGGSLTFCNVTINSSTTLDTGDDMIQIGGGCTLTNNGVMKRTTPTQNQTTGMTLSYADAASRTTAQLTSTGGTALGSTYLIVTMHQSPGGGNAPCGSVTLGGQPVLRHFNITPQNTSNGAATVRLYFASSELNTNDLANLGLFHCNGTAWQRASGTLSAAGPDGNGYYYVEVPNVTSFTPFAIGGGPGAPTAVTLSSFTGNANARMVDGALMLGRLVAGVASALAVGGVWRVRRKR